MYLHIYIWSFHLIFACYKSKLSKLSWIAWPTANWLNCQLTLHYRNLDYLTHLQYAIVTGASDFSALSKVLGSVNELWLWIQPNILLMSAWSVFCLSLLISVCCSLEVKWSDVTIVIASKLAAHLCAVWIHCRLSFW